MFQDVTGRDIEVGDIIAYTASAGQSVSSINVGTVTRFSAKSLWVQDVDPETHTPKQIPDGYMRGTGRFSQYNPTYEYQEFVQTGMKDVGESIVGNPAPHRFLIIRKI